MLKIRRVTKITRLISINNLVRDLRSVTSDEEICSKYRLNWKQLGRVYSRLYHEGFLSPGDLCRRIDMRGGRDASHIPLVRMERVPPKYACLFCGFESQFHFSECPKCRALNLRRLTRSRVSRNRQADRPAAIPSP